VLVGTVVTFSAAMLASLFQRQGPSEGEIGLRRPAGPAKAGG
jgi:hypothetical protein